MSGRTQSGKLVCGRPSSQLAAPELILVIELLPAVVQNRYGESASVVRPLPACEGRFASVGSPAGTGAGQDWPDLKVARWDQTWATSLGALGAAIGLR